MTDVLRLLPWFQWRGIQYPLASRSVTFAHEAVETRVQYQDNTFVEQLGAGSFVLTYTIPMREDIAKGPYKNLFTVGLPQLLKDFRDRTPGTLLDPVYGELRCVPCTWTDDIDVNKRDGTDLRLEWKYSPEYTTDDAAFQPPAIGELVTDSGQLDQELTKIDWEQEESPEGTTDIFSAINGFGRQVLGVADRINAKINDAAYKLEKIETTLDKLQNPQNWGFRQTARRLRDATKRLGNQLAEDPTIKIKKTTLTAAKTVSGCAQEFGMSVSDLLKMNPSIAKKPIVPSGTTVWHK